MPAIFYRLRYWKKTTGHILKLVFRVVRLERDTEDDWSRRRSTSFVHRDLLPIYLQFFSKSILTFVAECDVK
jgi:hypothetical protein